MIRGDRLPRENGQNGPGRTAGTPGASGDDPAILKRRLEYAWEEIEQLTKDLALARKTASEQTDNSAKSLLAARQEIDTLSQSLEEKERTLAANAEQCRHFEGEVATLHRELQEKDRLLGETAAQYQRMDGDLKERNLALDAIQRKLAHAGAELEAAREQAASLQAAQQETEARLQDLFASEAARAVHAPGIAGKSASLYQWLSRRTGHSYRLPSEAEWEYAARAGSEAAFWWGPRLEEGKAICFDCESQWGNQSTVPVGRFQPNPFGLYDTAGNAMEWVADCYHPNYKGAPADGSAWVDGDCGFRVARGGAFNKPSKSMRSTARHRYEIETRIDMLGFRLARDV